MAEELLNGTEVSAVGEEMGREGVAERVGVQVPIDVDEADVFLDDAADGALRQAAAGIIEENGFRVRSGAAACMCPGSLKQKLFAQRPVLLESFLGLRAVGNDAFLVALSTNTENSLFLFHICQVEAGEFADAQACGIEQFKESAIAAKKQSFFKGHELTRTASLFGT